MATIYPIASVTRELAGESMEVRVLLPAGSSPATFELTPRHLEDSERARVILTIGAGLDSWVGPLVSRAGGGTLVTLSDDIHLHDDGHGHEEGAGNPHIWLDPVLMRDRILPAISGALREIAPQEAMEIEARAAAMADSLTALDSEIRQALAPLETRGFMATHPAWIYFAERYALQELGVVHEHPGAEPSARELGELVEAARAAGVRVVFTEPQLGEAAVRALATELGVPTLLLDPLGGPDEEERDDYLSLLRFNTRQLVLGLGGER